MLDFAIGVSGVDRDVGGDSRPWPPYAVENAGLRAAIETHFFSDFLRLNRRDDSEQC